MTTRAPRFFVPSSVLSLALFGFVTSAAAQELRIHHLDVEQGDATLIISPDGHALLFDAGNVGKGRDRVIPRLMELGVASLDYTVLSHYDADHAGGLDEVLLGGYSPVIGAYDRGDGTTRDTQVVASYRSAAGPMRRTAVPGEVLHLGAEVSFEVVAVNGVTSEGTSATTSPDEENENSVALVLHYRDFDYFVAGDLTAGGLGSRDMESLVAPIVRDLDVLRVSHHGSATSSNQLFLDRTAPEVAVISDGCSNVYGHPDQGVIDRLTGLSSLSAIWVTNRGNLTVTSPKMIVVGESTSVDGEIVLRTNGTTSYSLNGVSYPIVADHAAPVITGGPTVADVTGDRATITWATDERAEVIVEYGFSTSYGSSVSRRTLARDHSITLTNLAPQATYTFRVGSIDATGNGPSWSAPGTFTTLVAAGGVVINEVASYGSDVDEWIELFNVGAEPVAIGGWSLTDNDAHTFTFPASLVLPARAYVIVTSGSGADDADASDGRATFHAGIAGRFGTTSTWNNDGDDVELRDARGVTVDWMAYGSGAGLDPAPAGHFVNDVANPTRPLAAQSVARYPNGADHNTASDWARPAAQTKGTSNGGEPPPPPSPPIANAGETVYGAEGAALTFDGSASQAVAPATIVSWSWSFGDGTTATGAVVTHAFPDDGSYQVVLTVTDSNGLVAVDGISAELTNVAPSALISGPSEVLVGGLAELTAIASDVGASDEPVLQYRWDFGDGSPIDSGRTAWHFYEAAGDYVVTLTVDDGDGGTTVATWSISVRGWVTESLAITSVRDQSTGVESPAGSAIAVELESPAAGGVAIVSGGATKWMEARFAGPTASVVSDAEVTVGYRMLSSRWSGTLRLELWSNGVLLGSTVLAKSTSLASVRWNVSDLVGPEHAANLAVRMVNIVPGAARVEWAHAAVSLTYR